KNIPDQVDQSPLYNVTKDSQSGDICNENHLSMVRIFCDNIIPYHPTIVVAIFAINLDVE
ncbi:MAG: hypothetical protein QNL11_07180, partial [Desulfobacterales bacterium]|nr:hypothetical protein [Desulfobacterales bacterium]